MVRFEVIRRLIKIGKIPDAIMFSKKSTKEKPARSLKG
jgi:hypothetical protein